VLADLDAEAKRTGRARMEVIVDRCRPRRVAAPKPKPPDVTASGLPLGPPVYTPGSRLKKR